MGETAVIIKDQGDLGTVSALPTIAEVRQRMAWMTEFRPVLIEFVSQHMDPARHMYSFENNRYTPLTVDALHTMMEKGHKPALNQDGIHNLMSLYECYADEPTITELREDGYYTCRATVKLISFRSGQAMGAGTGSCSTRESKYAYRWVGERQLPKGLALTGLKSREMESRTGTYVRYRLNNEDMADMEATVLKMAIKRAKSAAVQALPLVSEMFSTIGDADEDSRDADAARQAILTPLSAWIRSMKSTLRARAVLAVFGEPLRPDDIAKLDEDRLAVALQVVEIGTKAGVDWGATTLVADLRQALAASAAQARTDLFGDEGDSSPTASAPPPPAPKTPWCDDCNTAGHYPEECPFQARNEGRSVISTPNPTPMSLGQEKHNWLAVRGQKQAPADEPAWKRALRKHQEAIAQMATGGVFDIEARQRLEDLAEKIYFALSPLTTVTNDEGENLAAAVEEWIDAARHDI